MALVNPTAVSRAIDMAWNSGHILMGFMPDTEDSVVTECVRCGRTIGVDGDDINDGLGGECLG